MPDRIRVACVQLTSRADKAANLEKTERLVARAAATGADLVVLPEKWNAIGSSEVLHAAAESLEGAELVTVPANFTLDTGKDHWHILLPARAIENQVFVAAAAQVGETIPGKPSYGRSLVADPWGIVLAQAADEETVISAEIDRE